jgi:hypothetical protein
MDVALAIFNIGVGLGVLAAGIALVYLAWQTTPLIRESRALARDLRRLARTTDEELRPLLAQAREVAGGVEVLSADVAVQVDRLSEATAALERSIGSASVPLTAGRGETLPVESWETREDAANS